MTQEKHKVMLKYEDGYIMSKCQMNTLQDGLKWNFAKSPGKTDGVKASAKVFEEHGYEVVEWDDGITAFGETTGETIKIERKPISRNDSGPQQKTT